MGKKVYEYSAVSGSNSGRGNPDCLCWKRLRECVAL